MRFTTLAALLALVGHAAARLAAALPAIPTPAPMPAQLGVPLELAHDDVMLPRPGGGFDVVKDWEWSHMERRMEKKLRDEAEDIKRRTMAGEFLPPGAKAFNETDAAEQAEKQRRGSGCQWFREVQVLADNQFTGEDVAMSPIISSLGGPALVAVGKGYTATEGWSGGGGADLSVIPSFLSVRGYAEKTKSWATADTQTFTYTLLPGQYGIVVSNPWTRRVSGNFLTGCLENLIVSWFLGDKYEDHDFGGNLHWPRGPIRLCNNTVYPIPYCIGSDTHT